MMKRGYVVDDKANPVGNALVGVASATVPTRDFAIRTDFSGSFRIPLPVGSFRLQATTRSGATGMADLTVTADQDPGTAPVVIQVSDPDR